MTVLWAGVCAADEAKTPAITDGQVLLQTSFETLQQTTNYMLLVVEAVWIKTSLLKNPIARHRPKQLKHGSAAPYTRCRIRKLRVKPRLQKIASEIQKTNHQLPGELLLQRLPQKQVLEAADEETKKTAGFKRDSEKLEKLSKKETSAQSRTCARKFTGFCGSLIEKYLKASR